MSRRSRKSPPLKCVGGPLDGQIVEVDANSLSFTVEEQHPLLLDKETTEYVLVRIPVNGQWVCVVEGLVGVLREPDNHPETLAVYAMGGKVAVAPIVASAFSEEGLQTSIRDYLATAISPRKDTSVLIRESD